MKLFRILLLTICVFSCKSENEKSVTGNAEAIVSKAIQISGGDKFKSSEITFKFRDKTYSAIRQNGKFNYKRIFKLNEELITDELNNKGFNRYINDEKIQVSDSLKALYSASVNSVHYFSVLPFGLKDKAVNHQFIETEELDNNLYYKIKVTFNEDGGGEDFDDVFVYWINVKTYKVAFLAYSYVEDDGKGYRFRTAFNERYINKLRFVDYKNYAPTTSNIKIEDLAKYYIDDKLKLVSEIILEDVFVK